MSAIDKLRNDINIYTKTILNKKNRTMNSLLCQKNPS